MRFLNTTILGVMLMLGACSKSLDIKPVSFDVVSTKTNGQATNTFKTTDTIVYRFTGTPDVITFFSGAVGQRYEFRDRITAEGKPQLQFTSLRANGTQSNSIQLMISTDFKGVVAKSQTITGVITRDTAATNTNVAAASWTDISNRAAWSAGAATPSGIIDLSDYLAQGKPVFIAFKYMASAGSIQNKWTISAFALSNILKDNTIYTQANFAAANQLITNYGVSTPGLGWLTTTDPTKNPNNYAWVYTTGTGTGGSLVVTGAAMAASATTAAEAWAIMGPVDLRKVTPDAGIAIKDISAQTKPYTSLVVYTPGNYTPTFVASNNNADRTSGSVKQVPITIITP